MKIIVTRAHKDSEDSKYYKIGNIREVEDERAKLLIEKNFAKEYTADVVKDLKSELESLKQDNEVLVKENKDLKSEIEKLTKKDEKVKDKD